MSSSRNTSSSVRKRKASDDRTHSTAESSGPQGSGSVSPTSGPQPNPKEQLAGYALEILRSTSGTRHHAFGILIHGSSMELWYYDAAGIISTENTISIEHDFGLFATVIAAFCCCSERRWGHLDIIKHEHDTGLGTFPLRTFKGGTIDIKDVHIVIGDKIRSQHALVGRRTAIYGATVIRAKESLSGVIKMSYQVTMRTPEWEFIQKGHDSHVEHLPEVTAYQDFSRFSEEVWGVLFPDNGHSYEDRVLRIIVLPRYTPIREVINADNFATALYQLVNCE